MPRAEQARTHGSGGSRDRFAYSDLIAAIVVIGALGFVQPNPAVAELAPLPDGPVKDALTQFAGLMVDRLA